MSTAGGTTILVVEDEPLVRLSVRHYLERHGYSVLEAECASEAFLALRARRVDLLLTDFRLRKGHGLEVVQRARELNPALPWLLMSAYPLTPWSGDQPGLEPDQILQKPFTEAELLARVRECLTRRQL